MELQSDLLQKNLQKSVDNDTSQLPVVAISNKNETPKWIMVLGIIFLLEIVGGGYYLWFINKENLDNRKAQVPPPTSTSSPITVTKSQLETNRISIVATIVESGSTYFADSTLSIFADGSGTNEFKGTETQLKNTFRAAHISTSSATYPAETFTAIINVLAQIDDVSKIPAGNCAKSGSNNSTLIISYKTITSTDLTCISPNASQLYKNLVQEVFKAPNFQYKWTSIQNNL